MKDILVKEKLLEFLRSKNLSTFLRVYGDRLLKVELCRLFEFFVFCFDCYNSDYAKEKLYERLVKGVENDEV